MDVPQDSPIRAQTEKHTPIRSIDNPLPIEKSWKDIRNALNSSLLPLGKLCSTKDLELTKVYHVIGSSTVTILDLVSEPPWLFREAYKQAEKNWDGFYQSDVENSM